MYVSSCIFIGLLAFLIGSVPFGIVLAKLFGLPDPRTIGSGNIGATNMLRTGNKKVALLTLLLDGGKGALAVALAYTLFHASYAQASFALLAAVVGHCYSPWLRGNGGKGVATALGGALALSWPVGAGACCIWLLVFVARRYSSLAAITALAALPVIAWLRMDDASALIVLIAAAIVIVRHHENIRRLLRGEESRFKKSDGAANA